MTPENDHELLIRLEVKLDNALGKLDLLPQIEERVRNLEIDTSTLSDMKKDIEKLEDKSNAWSVLNSLGVLITGLIAFLKGS